MSAVMQSNHLRKIQILRPAAAKNVAFFAIASAICNFSTPTASTVASANVFSETNGLTSIQFVPIGNPGNAGTPSGSQVQGGAGDNVTVGQVNYTYGMANDEITVGQYVEFLNAVASTDTFGLYTGIMSGSSPFALSGGIYAADIVQSGSTGNFTYGPGTHNGLSSHWANLPMNYVTYGDAIRFCNWLANGQPNTHVENTTTTENGSYNLANVDNGTISLLGISRTASASYVVPTEDEWFKAAYYNPATSSYNQYATAASTPITPPTDAPPGSTGNNLANFSQDGGPPDYRTVVGSYINSTSPYGTHDQNGNVWEMTQTVDGNAIIVRGGGFFSDSNFGAYSGVRETEGVGAASSNVQFGFRIAQVPEPSSLTFLTLSAALLIRRRKN